MANGDLKEFLNRLNKNLYILKEREAKYGMTAPLDLLNQIDDYTAAIAYTEAVLNDDSPPGVAELEEQFQTLILGIKYVLVATEPERPIFTGDDAHPPYRGLQKFTEDDHDYFFGRTAAIDDLLAKVQYLVDAPTSAAEPDLLAVLGASGSGKSSLVRAGLIPALRSGQTLPGSQHWPVAVMQPGPRPLETLAQSLVPHLPGRGLPSIQDDLKRGPAVLHQLMLEALAERPDEAIFVLGVDQFEELFTQTETETERQAFLDMLLHAAQVSGNRSFIILTMRADFYAQAGQYKALAGVITRHQLLVAPMDERELREAILRPAEAVGLELDKGLEERLIHDTLDQPGSLPLLQHALLELYHRREEDTQAAKHHARLTRAAYKEIGGVQGALAIRADTVLNSLTPAQQDLARDIFLRLTSLGEGTVDTRRRVTRTELYPGDVDQAQVDAVLATLTDPKSRLVVTDRDSVEVTHEALIQRWDTLQGWLKDNRESLQIHRHLTEAATAWDRLKRDPGELYRGARLARAQEWQIQQQPHLTPLEAGFLQASIDAVEAEAAQHRRNRQQAIGIAAAVAAVIIGLLATGFWLQSRNATEQANLRSTAEAEAARAETQAGIAQDNANKAAIAQAEAEAETARAEEEKQRAEENQVKAERQQAATKAETARAEYQTQIARSQALAITSQQIESNDELQALLAREAYTITQGRQPEVSGLLDSTLRLIRNKPFFGNTLMTPENVINTLAFSADNQWLGAGSSDSNVYLWALADPEADPRILAAPEDAVSTLAFSADDQWLAAGSADRNVYLWSLTEPQADPRILAAPEDAVSTLAFSADDQWLAAGSWDSNVYLWSLAEPQADPRILAAPEAEVWSLAFSADDQWLAAGSADRNVYLWSLAEPQADPRILDAPAWQVRSLAFSADGQWLAAGSWDSNVYLWSLAEPQADPRILAAPEARVRSLAFSTDGQWLAAGSEDSNVHLWSLAEPQADPRILAAPEGWVRTLAFSTDGQWLAARSEDSNVHLWSLAEPQADPRILAAPEAEVRSLAFSADDRWLAAGSADSNVYLWSLAEPQADPRILAAPEAEVSSLAFSADDQWLAAGSYDSNVYLFEVQLEDAASALCQRVRRNLTREEWRQYMPPDMTYRATCPNLPLEAE